MLFSLINSRSSPKIQSIFFKKNCRHFIIFVTDPLGPVSSIYLTAVIGVKIPHFYQQILRIKINLIYKI